MERHGVCVSRHVDAILETLKIKQRATPYEALVLLQQLLRLGREDTRLIVMMVEDFLYQSGQITDWEMVFFARGLGAGKYVLPMEVPFPEPRNRKEESTVPEPHCSNYELVSLRLVQ